MTKKLFWVGDAVAQTGFARVTHGVLDQLYKTGDYDISVLGVNYNGDPHDYPYRIYPARLGGDLLGYNRLAPLVEIEKPDILVLFNDIWVVLQYLKLLEECKHKVPMATYFPVDSRGYIPDWVKPLYTLDKVFVYTNFAVDVLQEAGFKKPVTVIPHGIDTDMYFPIKQSEARASLNGLNPDDFIVFNGNRNQPRKRIDITVKGFCQFAKDKPDARFYAHMGIVDAGWDLIPLVERECKRHGMKGETGFRLILTHPNLGPANAVTEKELNVIYNTADVGINTSLGEGWGLVPFEQAACGVPQITTDYSASKELFEGRGHLLPIRQFITAEKVNTEGGLVHEDDVAEALEHYYNDKDQRMADAAKVFEFTQKPEFRWENIAKIWDRHLKEL